MLGVCYSDRCIRKASRLLTDDNWCFDSRAKLRAAIIWSRWRGGAWTAGGETCRFLDLPLVDSAVATARTMPGSLKWNSDKAHKKTRVLLSDNSWFIATFREYLTWLCVWLKSTGNRGEGPIGGDVNVDSYRYGAGARRQPAWSADALATGVWTVLKISIPSDYRYDVSCNVLCGPLVKV